MSNLLTGPGRISAPASNRTPGAQPASHRIRSCVTSVRTAWQESASPVGELAESGVTDTGLSCSWPALVAGQTGDQHTTRTIARHRHHWCVHSATGACLRGNLRRHREHVQTGNSPPAVSCRSATGGPRDGAEAPDGHGRGGPGRDNLYAAVPSADKRNLPETHEIDDLSPVHQSTDRRSRPCVSRIRTPRSRSRFHMVVRLTSNRSPIRASDHPDSYSRIASSTCSGERPWRRSVTPCRLRIWLAVRRSMSN